MKLLILGAGGHGRVVADAAQESSAGCTEIAFLDDRHPALSRAADWPIVGRFDALAGLTGRYEACIAAVGDARLRLSLIQRARETGFKIPLIVHARATVSRRAQIDVGTVVAAGAVVNIGCHIATGCIINTGATVDHDCRLEPGVHICPGAHLAGDVQVGARSWIGIGAVVRQGIQIGADATVGAGAVCVENVRDGALVSGVPARERAP